MAVEEDEEDEYMHKQLVYSIVLRHFDTHCYGICLLY